jgi:hypothetical protein
VTVAQLRPRSDNTSRLPTVLSLTTAIAFVLLFLWTGSVVLPLKALLLNLLSLTATFGALVWIFQDGHLSAFGTTATGTLTANMPVLLFCIAFGLSMATRCFWSRAFSNTGWDRVAPGQQRRMCGLTLAVFVDATLVATLHSLARDRAEHPA